MCSKARTPVILFALGLTLGVLLGSGVPGSLWAEGALVRADLSGVEGRELIVWRNAFPPGAVSARHHHPGDEVLYVLSGTIEVEQGGAVRQLAAGEALHVAAGAAMSTRNPSDDTASEFLVIMVHKSGAPVSVKH